MDKFITLQDIAIALKISIRAVYKLVRNGKIKAIHVSGEKRKRYRVLEKELDRFMAEEYERRLND